MRFTSTANRLVLNAPYAGISYRLAVIFFAVTNKNPTFAIGNR